ncbi:MAG TPA: glycosyltransferase family 4 protein [Candidatus Thermoplasmatota archaeon]|nr:glycosyltransferase family 4 protein [Candidatus Thermoplasmatota archaeon]
MTDLSLSLLSPYYPRADRGSVEDGFVGGVEVAQDCLSRALASLGVDVTVYSTATEAGEEVIEGVRHVRVKRWGTLFRTPMSGLPFKLPLESDILQVPGTYPLWSDVPIARARRRGVPTVLDYHFDAHPTSVPMAAAVKTYYPTLGRLARRADLVFVKSLDYARASVGLHGIPEARIRELPNGVDVSRFEGDFLPGNHVLCVGRLIPYKGVDVLLRAMKEVQERLDAPVWIAGTGPLREDLERFADTLKVDAKFLGFVPDAALPHLYGSARLTALPSRNSQEAFGICLLESMAAGTPVVAPDLPGVRGVASEGGVVFGEAGDEHALAEAIVRILKGDTPVPRGTALRERIAAKYSWHAIAKRALAEYERLLEEGPA